MSIQHGKSRTFLFWLLAFMEFFERYEFYVVMVLLMLLLTNHLHWNDKHAYIYTAAVSSLFYIAPLADGWITDNYLNNRISLVISALLLYLGYMLLSFWHQLGINAGMTCLILGMAFFKFSPSAMIGQLYNDDKSQMDRLFVIFYVSINVGALISFFSAGWLAFKFGWSYVFLLPTFDLLITAILAW